LFSAPAILPPLWLFAWPINWGAPASAWAGFFYGAVFSMFLGFFAWSKGLAIGGIAKVGQIQLLQPFVALAARGPPVGGLARTDLCRRGGGVAVGWHLQVAQR